MKQFKGFIAGIIVTSLLFTSVAALPAAKSIKAMLDGVKLVINSKEVKTNSIIYNNTVYLPIQTVSNISNKNYVWDSKTGILKITDKVTPAPAPKPTPAPAPTPKPEPAPAPAPVDNSNSRLNPANINEPMYLTTTNYDKSQFESTITVTEIVRGAEAWQRIYNKNKYNTAAPEGYEYILSKIKVKLLKSSVKDLQFQVDTYDFTLVSSSGIDYERKSVVIPDPELDAKLYEGGELEGWVAFLVKSSDKLPVIAFGRDYNGRGGVWYKGYNPENQLQNQSPATDQTSNTPSQTNLATKQDLINFLDKNYGSLETVIGKTNFTFDIYENTMSIQPYDYWIKVKYDYNFFGGAMINIKYTDEQKNTLRQQLKNHQEALGKAVIAAMPTKKFYGCYYDSWYKYPNLRVDLQARYYYSWTNYDEPGIGGDIYQIYNNAKVGQFRWYSLIDNTL